MNQRYLLDTNIITNMMRATTGIASRNFARVTGGLASNAMLTSMVVLCELRFGLNRNPNPRLELALEHILGCIEVVPLDSGIVPHYASLRAQLEAAGTPIGPNDTLIAAHALALDATLVSGDAEFARVPGLKLENWLQPL